MKASIRATSEEDSVGGRPVAFLGSMYGVQRVYLTWFRDMPSSFCNTCLIHSRIFESFDLNVLPQIFIYHENGLTWRR